MPFTLIGISYGKDTLNLFGLPRAVGEFLNWSNEQGFTWSGDWLRQLAGLADNGGGFV